MNKKEKTIDGIAEIILGALLFGFILTVLMFAEIINLFNFTIFCLIIICLASIFYFLGINHLSEAYNE